jgi:DNA-binding GntR family transcriptional regulator
MNEPSDNLALVRHTTQEAVVDHIRTLILNRELKPGDRLVQSELAEQLGVSRTPIREALHTLASEGLVTFSAYKGASVARFSLTELEEIYNVRIALEGWAVRLAAQRISEDELADLESLASQIDNISRSKDHSTLVHLNRQFHLRIFAAAGQKRIYDLIESYADLADRYQPLFVLERRIESSLEEHKELLETLRQRDSDKAERLTREHIQRIVSLMKELFDEGQEEGE